MAQPRYSYSWQSATSVKTIPIEEDEHLLAVLRYVERNALQANLVEQAEDWKFGSLWRAMNLANDSLISDWPIPKPRTWRATLRERGRPKLEKTCEGKFLSHVVLAVSLFV